MIKIYTDGACSGNPGIGGWGAVIFSNSDDAVFLNGGENITTNNRMELTAAIKSIAYFKNRSNLEIFTDSKYLKDGIEKWILDWKKNGWKTADKKDVKNKDLWKELDKLSSTFYIEWIWVKAHSTDALNNEVDLLARSSASA